MCSKNIRKGAKFCWNCNSDQSKIGPPNWTPEKLLVEQTGTSFGRSFDGQKKKAMSFEMYKKSKAEEQKGGCNFRAKKRTKMQEAEQVTIMVGMKQLIAGYQAAIAWNYEDGDQEYSGVQSKEKFQSADLSVAGVLRWLTGQKHKPVCDTKFTVGVYFNHDCLKQNPDHRVCFPIVGACGKQITFPVAHMTTTEEFRELFILAFCKGQAFARP